MDPLYELLAPYFDRPDITTGGRPVPSPRDPHTTSYLSRLSTLSLPDLSSTEPASLLQSAQSHLRNLQSLAKRSQKAVITSSAQLADLSSILPSFESQVKSLHNGLPELETAATDFATKYSRSTENTILDRRKQAILLSRNVDRVTDVLDLPSLLSSTVSATQAPSATSSSGSSTSYGSALDLHAHIKRLRALYPQSEVVHSISNQAELEIQNLTSILITSLHSPYLKLAGAMRTIGWLRRVAPDLAEDGVGGAREHAQSTKAFKLSKDASSEDGSLGTVFLVCRLRTLHSTLDALDPLRELADQEAVRRKQGVTSKLLKQQVSASALGSQSERYLKRYIEVFREQSFNIISMYKSIFPSNLPTSEPGHNTLHDDDTPYTSPCALSSFSLHLVEMLMAVLAAYMPNINDGQARESLLTQVLYCAGSLGRLGADFGMMIALLEETMEESSNDDVQDHEKQYPEWVQVMKKHRVQAGRLEILARGVGSRKVSGDGLSPTPLSAS